MTQVKFFERKNVGSLEVDINKFIEENDGSINIKDIKFILGSYNCYNAMVIYETI